MNGLSGAIHKPDLLLCEEGVIAKRVSEQGKFDMRTDVYFVGEVKKKYNEEHKKDLYVKLARKVAFILEAQDGRCAVPGIQILGMTIILTFFDRGSSALHIPSTSINIPNNFCASFLASRLQTGYHSASTPPFPLPKIVTRGSE